MSRIADNFQDIDVVAELYLGLLQRTPDAIGAAANLETLRSSGLAKLIDNFVNSSEFKAKHSHSSLNLNWSGPMTVQTGLKEAELASLWAHVAGVWTGLGETDPYWSVLTHERFRSENLSDRAIIEDFYQSGQEDVRYLKAFVARSGVSLDSYTNIAEYGCGVGRVTRFLAKEFAHVRAFDISRPHLAAAKLRLDAEKINNVDYVLVQSKDDLGKLEGIDLFFSLIVLQHNPPPIGLDILAKAFSALRPKGLAFFQVPTYAEGYEFKLETFWDVEGQKKRMEMHFVPQKDIFRLATQYGLTLLEVRQDHWTGSFDTMISNTFLMQKSDV